MRIEQSRWSLIGFFAMGAVSLVGCVPGGETESGVTGGTGQNGGGGAPATGGAPSGGAAAATGGKSTGGVGTGGATSGGASTGGKATGGTATGGAARVTGSIVPLYTDPGDSSWSAMVAAKNAHPSVPVIAILNPDNGPGSAASSAYASGIPALTGAGIRVIGYVYTSYGARASATVRTDIDRWHSWYPAMNGIFFDEESNTPGTEAYYGDLSSYVKSLGMTLAVGNPGTETGASYVNVMDVTFIYESAGLPSSALLTSWQAAYPRAKVGVIPYASSLSTSFIEQARGAVGYIYVTDDDLPNPWDTLPSFFSSLLAALE
jgi:hypothetical protein